MTRCRSLQPTAKSLHLFLSHAVFRRVLCSGRSSSSLFRRCRNRFNAHHVQYHIFADVKQLFASAPVAEAHEAKKTVERCVAAVMDWCASRRLRLNDGKTAVIWLGSRRCRRHQLAGVDLNVSVGSDTIRTSVVVVRGLGVFIDAELTFREPRRVISRLRS